MKVWVGVGAHTLPRVNPIGQIGRDHLNKHVRQDHHHHVCSPMTTKRQEDRPNRRVSRVWAPTPDHTLRRVPVTEQEQADWQERLQAAVAETIRRRQERRQQREQLQAARAIGLQRRHTQKLNRKERP